MRPIRTYFAFIFTLLGISLIIWFIYRGYYVEDYINPHNNVDLGRSAQMGDFIGGLVGTLFTLVGIILLYETLTLQRKEFAANKEVLTRQQFDNTFFSLLKLHHSNVENFITPHSFGSADGKAFFDYHKSLIKDSFKPQKALSKNRKEAVDQFEKFYVRHLPLTATYFRTLFRLYQLIDNSNLSEKDKVEYSKILRIQLSDSELFFIRYNAMTEQGARSGDLINKYNYLKHLSNFELLEFKDWWVKLDAYEKNGLGIVIKDLKRVLKLILKYEAVVTRTRDFKKRKYSLQIDLDHEFEFSLGIIRRAGISVQQRSLVDGFDKFSDKELENFLECLVKEIVIYSNFNQFNNRRNLNFFSNTNIENNETVIRAGVRNSKRENINIFYPHEDKKDRLLIYLNKKLQKLQKKIRRN